MQAIHAMVFYSKEITIGRENESQDWDTYLLDEPSIDVNYSTCPDVTA
jgi:hypothetical protein